MIFVSHQIRQYYCHKYLYICVLLIVGLIYGRIQTIAAGRTEGQIESPRDEEEVGNKIIAHGSIRDLPPNGHLWLAVKKGDLIWPKEPEVPVTGSSWAVTVYEGETPSGDRFDFVLYLVDAEGHQQIREWLRIGNTTGSYPGIRKITESSPLHTIQLRMR